MKKVTASWIGLVLLGVIVVVVNGISRVAFGGLYWDLTDEGLYTLSKGTKNIIHNLESPVVLRYYFSKSDTVNYPALRLYGSRIADLLREYERSSAGRVKVEIYDPRPDTEEEDWAQKYGITPMALPSGEKIFIGLAGTNSRGDEQVIPVFNIAKQESLEYDVTNLLYSLTIAKRRVIGILSPLPIEGSPSQMPPELGGTPTQNPWMFPQELKNTADVRFIKTDAEKIDDDVDVLMVIHPKGFNDKLTYAIDQFVLRGGRLFLAVDPYCQADQPKQDPSNPMAGMLQPRNSNLEVLLKHWGVELIDKKVVGDAELATKVNQGRGGAVQDFVLFLSLRPVAGQPIDVVNKSEIITAGLDSIVFPWAGALKISKQDGLETEVLLASTKQSELVDENLFRFNGGDPQGLLRSYVPGNEQYPLAVRIRGNATTAFPNGAPAGNVQEPKPEMSAPGQPLTKSVGAINVVVVADVDFMTDPYSVSVTDLFGTKIASRINDNMLLVQNIVENLGGSDDLISLRSRGVFTRPFIKVQEIERQAAAKWQVEEQRLQAQLQAANQRLSQLQAGSAAKNGEKDQVFSDAVLEEIKKFRNERAEAQERLRQVRRNLRADKERLGEVLFLLNTFLVPLLLVVGAIVLYVKREKERRVAR